MNHSRWCHSLPAAFVLAVLAACRGTGEDAGWSGKIETLASGTVRVSNPRTSLWGKGEGWSLAEDLRIGSADVEGPTLFGDIVGVDTDAMGRIFVAEGQAGEVRVFDPAGRHVRTFGRKGQGPGEFQQLAGIAWGPDGNLWAMDIGNGRVSVFDTAGVFIASHLRASPYGEIPWPGGFDTLGRFYDLAVVSGSTSEPMPVLVRHDPQLRPLDTLPIPVFTRERFELRAPDGQVQLAAGVPFTPTQLWQMDRDGGIWIGTTEDYRIHKVDFSGDTVRTVVLSYQPVPVSDEERDEALEKLAWFRNKGGRVELSRIPAEKPAFRSISVDDGGFLWVRPSAAAGERTEFDVFEQEGRYMGRVASGIDFGPEPVISIRGGRIYAAIRDDMDVPHVVRLQIEKRASGSPGS